MTDKSNNKKGGDNFIAAMGLGLELGFMIVLPLVGFMLLGLWIDKKLGTTPLFVFFGIAVGIASAAVEVIKVIIPFLEKRSQKK